MADLEEGYGDEDENWEEEAFLEGMEEAEFGSEKREPFLGELEDEFAELEAALEEEFPE